MAVVGVASFPRVVGAAGEEAAGVPLQASLLLGLLDVSLGQLLSEGSPSESLHPLLEGIVRAGAPQLKEAVVVAMPALVRAVTQYWAPDQLPSGTHHKLVHLLSAVFNHFNRFTQHNSLCLPPSSFTTPLPLPLALFLQRPQLVHVTGAEPAACGQCSLSPPL